MPPTLGAASVQRLVTNAVCPFRVDQQTATQNCMPQLQRTQLARKRVGSDNDVCCDDAADDSNVPGRDGNRATPCPTKRPRKLDLAGTTAPDARDSSRAIFASRLRCSFTICSALAEAAAERPPTADSAGKSNPLAWPHLPRMKAPLLELQFFLVLVTPSSWGWEAINRTVSALNGSRLALDVVARW